MSVWDLLFDVLAYVALGAGLGAMWYARRLMHHATLSLESANAAMAIAITERQEAIRIRASLQVSGGRSE